MRSLQLSQTLAGPCETLDAFEISAKAEDFRHFCKDRSDALATLATLAGGKIWAQGIGALLECPAPTFMARSDWDRLTWRTFQFAIDWADDGLRLDWSLLEMFGSNPDPSVRRVDRNGVAMTLGRMLSPLTVAAVDANAWHLADQRGALLRFPRMDLYGQVPMWIAYSARAGP